MKLAVKLLAHSGVFIAVSAAIMGASAVHAANVNPAKEFQKPGITAPNKPSSDGPLEDRVKRAIEEIDQKGQAALEELGVLDSGETIAQADQILEQMEQATREVKKQAHDRTAERLQELNDIADTRLQYQAQADLQDLGKLDNQEKRQKADEIRARFKEQRERLANSWNQTRERLEQRHQQRALPEFIIRQPNGQPPTHAPALGLRARTGDLSEEEVDAIVLQLEREAKSALEDLGELDTPEKQQRAEAIRSKIEEQVNQLRERLANRAQNVVNDQFEQQAAELRRRAQAALQELGNADSPEKQELARNIRAKLEDQLSAIRERLSDRTQLALEDQVDQETSALRRRAQVSLDRLGELDTPEKQEMARLIRARLEEQVQSVRERISRQARTSYDEQFQQDSEELQRRAQAALKELGRVDSLLKVERARQIRAGLEADINRLKREQVQRLRDGVGQGSDLPTDTRPDQVRDALTDRARDSLQTDLQAQRDRAGEIRDRTVDALRQNQEQRDQLGTRVDNLRDRLQGQTRQVIGQDPDLAGVRPRPEPHPAADTPPATPEPRPADERPASDSSASDATGSSDATSDGESQDRSSGDRP